MSESIKQLFADRILVCDSLTINDQELRRFTDKIMVEQQYNFMLRGLVITLDTYIHGIEKERIIVHKSWPKDWWQAVKERWFPVWALRRWPVEMTTLDIDRKIYGPVCPHLFHDDQHMHFEWMEREAVT